MFCWAIILQHFENFIKITIAFFSMNRIYDIHIPSPKITMWKLSFFFLLSSSLHLPHVKMVLFEYVNCEMWASKFSGIFHLHLSSLLLIIIIIVLFLMFATLDLDFDICAPEKFNGSSKRFFLQFLSLEKIYLWKWFW